MAALPSRRIVRSKGYFTMKVSFRNPKLLVAIAIFIWISVLAFQKTQMTTAFELRESIKRKENFVSTLKYPLFGKVVIRTMKGSAEASSIANDEMLGWDLSLATVNRSGNQLSLTPKEVGKFAFRAAPFFSPKLPSVDELKNVNRRDEIVQMLGQPDYCWPYRSISIDGPTIRRTSESWVKWTLRENGDVAYLSVFIQTGEEPESLYKMTVGNCVLAPQKDRQHQLPGD